MRPSTYGDPLSVGELCEGINAALRSGLGSEVWVRGAISGLNRSANGHVYFSLVDPEDVGQRPEAVLGVALFANVKHRVNAILKKTGSIRMEDGIEVAIAGSVQYFAPTGRLQLIMSMIDPNYTLGRLAESREATLKRLAGEGLLNRNRSIPLPVLPLRIALVTSEGSAAEADFMDELSASGIAFEVSLYDARVQGPDAPRHLAAAIGAAGASGVDVVAVVRGGGAKTDLVAFDSYEVAAAVAGCGVPVAVGVGHEIDRSICDEVAAVALKTPTATAAWIVQRVTDFDGRVAAAAARLANAAEAQLAAGRQRTATARHRLRAGVAAAVSTAHRRHDRNTTLLQTATAASLTATGHRLERAELRLTALDPATVMARGWSITRAADGSVVSSVAQVDPGDRLVTQLADGTVTSTATETASAEPEES